MKTYKTRYIAPLTIGIATLGFVAANSTPAAAADMAVYGPKTYGAKKKAHDSKMYGTKKKKMYGTDKK